MNHRRHDNSHKQVQFSPVGLLERHEVVFAHHEQQGKNSLGLRHFRIIRVIRRVAGEQIFRHAYLVHVTFRGRFRARVCMRVPLVIVS